MVYNISNTLVCTIDESKDAENIWDRINKLMIPNKANHILMLKSQLRNLRMASSAQEYLLQIDEKVRQINKLQDEFIADADIIGYIENGLPNSYKVNTKSMWLERQTHTAESLKEVIINYHTAQSTNKTLDQSNDTNSKEVSFSKTNYRKFQRNKPKITNDKLSCVNCPHLNNHTTENCWKKSKYCNYHRSSTHTSEECRKKPKTESHVATETSPEQFHEDNQDWAFVCESTVNRRSNLLTYDSACTNHLIKDIDLLFALKEYHGSITVANNNKMPITHSAKMILPGTNDVLDVLYCPSAIRNLISSAMLSKMGYRAVLSPDGTGSLEKGSTKIELTQQHGIWIFCNPQECSHSRLNDLMHRRMGHLGADSLSALLDPKNDMLARYEFTTAMLALRRS